MQIFAPSETIIYDYRACLWVNGRMKYLICVKNNSCNVKELFVKITCVMFSLS